MYCPKCRSEFREGFTHCADCDTVLVAELPPEPELEYVDFDGVLSTHSATDISVIKSILDGEKVEYYFRGELFNQLEPPVQPAILMVRKDQVETAVDLLKDLNVTFLSFGTRTD